MWTAQESESIPSALQPTPQPLRPPRITANRRQLDDRFPFLGFTVMTEGLPYYEVQLATDASLFMAANAAKRTEGNFFSSRTQSELIRASDADALYSVPAAVVQRFSKARAIYYRVIAYRDASGAGPVPSLSDEESAKNSPFVSVPGNFRGHTLAAVLCVAPDEMKRLNGNAGGLAEQASAAISAISPEEDRAEGEDGYGISEAQSAEAFDDDTQEEEYEPQARESASGETDEYDYSAQGNEQDSAYSDGFEEDLGEVTEFGAAEADAAQQYGSEHDSAEEPAHDDEGGEPYNESIAESQESTFPSGASAPSMLEDDDSELAGEGAYGTAAAASEEESFVEPFGSDEESPEPEYLSLDSPTVEAPPAATAKPFDVLARKRIISAIAPYESGNEGFAAINTDGEFQGRFGQQHPAYRKYHIGLSYGIIQFTQDSGMLGRLLGMMQARDPEAFRQAFGAQSDELLRVTNAPGPSSANSPGGRSARVQPVGGKDLWEEPWVSRFRAAARHVAFLAAQNELASAAFIDPMLRFARDLGLDSDRALTMVIDRAVQMGVAGAKRWLIEVVGPVQTAAQRQQALSALGHSDLQAFQRATAGLEANGQWTPETHAAMTGALRQLGARSPVPIPMREQMLDAIVRRSEGTPWQRRVQQLRTSNAFTDEIYQVQAA